MEIFNHQVKTWPDSFRAHKAGDKTFELRFNDRGFQRGDLFTQKEWDPTSETFSGDQMTHRIVYVLNGFGLQPGFVCLQLAPLNTSFPAAVATPAG